jgi:hypothetical protein
MTMATTAEAPAAPAQKKWLVWVGRVATALPILLLVFSASMKLMRSPEFLEQFVGKLGYPASTAVPIGVIELACAILYAIPRTAVLGAILVTAYLGGAVATHLRIGEPVFLAILPGIFVWIGLYLRDARLRALVPLVSASPTR